MTDKKGSKVRKVFHVVRRFVEEEWGGTESVVYNLADQLENKVEKSPVLGTDMLSTPGEEMMGKVKVRRFPICFPWFGLGDKAKSQLELKGGSPLCLAMFKYLRQQKDVSILHTHTEHRLGGIARTVARMKGIPYVVSLHGGSLTLPQEQAEIMQQPFKGKFEWGKIFGALLGSRRVLKDADAIICVGRDEYELMSKRYPEKDVVYQPNGVSLKTFENASGEVFQEKYNLKPNDKIILNVSHRSSKNQLALVRAFAELAKSEVNLKLVLIGPVSVQDYLQEIKSEAEKLGIEKQLLLIDGLKPNDSMLANAYKAADVFVLPSKHEPFGIVILEAWASGVPVVASNVGGIPGFTHHKQDILLVDVDDIGSLKESILPLLKEKDLAESLVSSAKEEVKKYDWSEITDQTLALYERLIERKF